MKAEVCTLVITALLFMGCNGVEFRYPTSADPCIIVKMEGNLSLSMIPTKGQTIKVDGDLNGATIGKGGHCALSGENMANLELVLTNDVSGTLSLDFEKGADSKVTMDVKFTFMPAEEFKNNGTEPVDMNSTSSIPLSNDTTSYTCTAKQEIKFSKADKAKYHYEMKMTISDVQIQAFGVNTNFSQAEDCTTKSNETTTEAPTTKSNATTEGPTTKSNATTTEAPTTKGGTTMATTTMAPAPPTPGSPETNTYTANNGTANSTTCLMIKAGIAFVIPYVSKTGNSSMTIGIPNGNIRIQGDCEGMNDTQTVKITFYNDLNLTLTFAKSFTKQYLADVAFNAYLNDELFPDIQQNTTVNTHQAYNADQFYALTSGSYRCKAKSKFRIGDEVEMNTYNLQYAAFQDNIKGFSNQNVVECPADTKTNSVVPIAVGAALAGLVVIVLIAYLIGRKRSRQSGYEQV